MSLLGLHIMRNPNIGNGIFNLARPLTLTPMATTHSNTQSQLISSKAVGKKKQKSQKSKATKSPQTHSVWVPEEEALLLEYAIANKASSVGGLNFKSAFWHGASAHLLEKGFSKGPVPCKTKWVKVRHISSLLPHFSHTATDQEDICGS